VPARPYRALIRGFASYWTDRPLFRVTTGLIPSSVWRTHFGTDRANLIGHQLDPDKLARKLPQNLSGLDLQLSLLEGLFTTSAKHWIFDGPGPSAADIALWYQLDWGEKISRGEGIADLTGGGTKDGDGEGVQSVLNAERYPGLLAWFDRVKLHFDALPSTETRVDRGDERGANEVLARLGRGASACAGEENVPLIPTPAGPHAALDARNGLVPGVQVSVSPDDTGRESPTVGTLVALTPEEVVISPQTIDGREAAVGPVRIHFPRIGFVIRPQSAEGARATL
jgi:glutathione S-transferase